MAAGCWWGQGTPCAKPSSPGKWVRPWQIEDTLWQQHCVYDVARLWQNMATMFLKSEDVQKHLLCPLQMLCVWQDELILGKCDHISTVAATTCPRFARPLCCIANDHPHPVVNFIGSWSLATTMCTEAKWSELQKSQLSFWKTSYQHLMTQTGSWVSKCYLKSGVTWKN